MNIRLAMICLASVAAVSTTASASPHRVPTEVHVSTVGVDFSRPASAKAFYASLRRAARKACASGVDHNLAVAASDRACAVDALDRAVQKLGEPSLMALHGKPASPGAPATVLAAN